LTPTAPGVHLALAAAYGAANQVEDAIAALQQAIILEPTLAAPYMELAKLYREQSRHMDAQAVYDTGLALVPSNGALYIAYCDFLVDQGDGEQALTLLAQADQIAPTVEMLMARSAVYTRLSRPDAALADLLAARNKEPGSLDVLLAL